MSSHLLDMRIQPIPLHLFGRQILRPGYPPFTDTLPSSTQTLKRLVHLPLGTRVEEREHIALPQRPVVDDAHLHAVHVEVQRRGAGVVDEDEVRVELDVAVATGLDGGVGFGGRGCGGDFGEEGAGGEGGLGDGRAGEGLWAVLDLEDVGMGWFDCGGRACSCNCSWRCRGLFDCDWGHCGGVEVGVEVVVIVVVRWDVVG